MAQLLAEEAARELLGGIGRTKWFELLKSGELRSVKIGRRRFVTAAAITDYIEALERDAA